MTTEIKSPTYPESVSDGTISNWVKKEGESVKQDELIAEIETDKATMEFESFNEGVLLHIGVQEGDSILDLGCGLGHMVEHLEKIGLNVRYTGIDTNKWSIQQAYQFREANYIHGTIYDVQDKYDWGLASGVFNVEFPKLEMLETINELLSKVNKGVAFNLLSSSSNNNLTYENHTPDEIVPHLKGDVSVVENYGVENDFTIYIKKN